MLDLLYLPATCETPDLPNRLSDELWKQALKLNFLYSIISLIAGLFCILAGAILFFFGIAGETNWVLGFIGIESELTDAPAGALLCVIGFFIIVATRFSIKSSSTN